MINDIDLKPKTKSHPKGLWLLCFTEVWERFSYYGMRAILILYLTKSYLQGGLAIDDQTAGLIYGTFTGLVYFTPLIGGWLADQYIGQRRSITIGAFVMLLGQLCLFTFNTHTGLYAGLLLLILGNGFFKPNIATLVGKLYQADDSRRDSAFTYFYMGVNVGALIAPVIIALISDTWFSTMGTDVVNGVEQSVIITHGYKYGFLVAAVGMFIGQIVYNTLGRKYLGELGLRPAKPEPRAMTDVVEESDQKNLNKVEKERISVIFIFFLFAIFFWAGFEQAGSSLSLYTDRYIDRIITLPFFGAIEIPTPFFQSVNPLFIIALAPLFAWFWNSRIGRKLTAPLKMGIGMIVLGIGFFFMLGAVSERGGDVEDITIKASLWWLVLTYLVHTMGELSLSPVGMSIVSKLSPPKLASVLMAVWFLSSFFANLLGGYLASTVAALGAGKIFFYISIFVIICGMLLISLNKVIVKMMHGIK